MIRTPIDALCRWLELSRTRRKTEEATLFLLVVDRAVDTRPSDLVAAAREQ